MARINERLELTHLMTEGPATAIINICIEINRRHGMEFAEIRAHCMRFDAMVGGPTIWISDGAGQSMIARAEEVECLAFADGRYTLGKRGIRLLEEKGMAVTQSPKGTHAMRHVAK